jgi:hypothetical protein
MKSIKEIKIVYSNIKLMHPVTISNIVPDSIFETRLF